jgi:hypothetical protein
MGILHLDSQNLITILDDNRMSDIPHWAQTQILPNGWTIAVMCGGEIGGPTMIPLRAFLFGQGRLVQMIDVASLAELEIAKAGLRLLAEQA